MNGWKFNQASKQTNKQTNRQANKNANKKAKQHSIAIDMAFMSILLYSDPISNDLTTVINNYS
jgi:hypothetical protein